MSPAQLPESVLVVGTVCRVIIGGDRTREDIAQNGFAYAVCSDSSLTESWFKLPVLMIIGADEAAVRRVLGAWPDITVYSTQEQKDLLKKLAESMGEDIQETDGRSFFERVKDAFSGI